MQTALIFVFLSCQFLAAHAQGTPKLQGEVPGRYQLFQGEYEFVNIKGESYRSKALFKVDTATGNLFVCEGTQVDGKHLTPPQVGKMVQRHYCRPFEGEIAMPLQTPGASR